MVFREEKTMRGFVLSCSGGLVFWCWRLCLRGIWKRKLLCYHRCTKTIDNFKGKDWPLSSDSTGLEQDCPPWPSFSEEFLHSDYPIWVTLVSGFVRPAIWASPWTCQVSNLALFLSILPFIIEKYTYFFTSFDFWLFYVLFIKVCLIGSVLLDLIFKFIRRFSVSSEWV